MNLVSDRYRIQFATDNLDWLYLILSLPYHSISEWYGIDKVVIRLDIVNLDYQLATFRDYTVFLRFVQTWIQVSEVTISFISDTLLYKYAAISHFPTRVLGQYYSAPVFYHFFGFSSFLGKLFLTGIIILTYLFSFTTNIFQTINQFKNFSVLKMTL
jgi:hypothetical protein